MDLVVITNAARFVWGHVTFILRLGIVQMAVKVDGKELAA